LNGFHADSFMRQYCTARNYLSMVAMRCMPEYVAPECLMGKLEWDSSFDYKTERSRK